MENQRNSFKQTNGFAMQYGVILGLCGFLSLVFMVLALTNPICSWLANLFMVGSPFLAAYFTFNFRKIVLIPELGFSFGRGFAFTFLMGLYATLWVALGVFVYLAYFDNGFVFDSFEKLMLQPDMVAMLRETGSWELLQSQYGGVSQYVANMRVVSPAQYAGSIIYLSILVAPIVSALIAFIARRPGNGWIMPNTQNNKD